MSAGRERSPRAASELRKLLRTDDLLEAARRAGLVEALGHARVVTGIREALAGLRVEIAAGAACPAPAELERSALERLAEASPGALRQVVNATGVVIHTNLGRAPLSTDALDAIAVAGRGYSNLEYDLDAGERGDR